MKCESAKLIYADGGVAYTVGCGATLHAIPYIDREGLRRSLFACPNCDLMDYWPREGVTA